MSTLIKIKITVLALTLLASISAGAEQDDGQAEQLTWPEGQLLPSFPAPAQVQDHIYLNSNTDAEMYLFASLKGLVNRRQPRIFSYEGDAFAEGPFTWLSSLGVSYNTTTPWAALQKYKSEISGLIAYDPAQLHTVNLASALAKDLNALIASPTLLSTLTSPPYSFPIVADLRGRFSSSLQVYQALYDSCWSNPNRHIDKRLLIGLSPEFHKAALREYAVALGAAVVWLDPNKPAESELLNRFLALMPAGANYMGWWPEEQPGVERLSTYGFTTIASDYCTNLTFHSGTSRSIYIRPMPAKPALENKIYVAFIISDGDNLQYVEHRMRRFWDDPNRGSVPIGWTISPAMVDAMPAALSYFHRSATDNDNLISGPSGYGYTYPNTWITRSLSDELANFVAKTEAYNVAAGLRVITVWNTITGGIDKNVGNIFADNAPTLLGLTAQNTGGAQSLYASKLPGKPLSCNYCTGVQAMKDHIITHSNGWNPTEPRFLIIQGNPWNSEVNPTGFKAVKEYFSSGEYSGKYVFVRPDHIFQLLREHNKLPVNPGGTEGDGEGLTGAYFNGTAFETEVASRIDPTVNFDWGTRLPIEGANTDNFSIRWKGKVMPRYSETYTFYLTCDKGGRLWIDNRLMIDGWAESQTTPGAATLTATIALTAGEKYDLKLEYYDDRATARCKLEWASAFQSREVIPQSQLFKDVPTGIAQYVSPFPEVKLYPSPSEKGVVNVEVGSYNGPDDVSLTVYDICGRIVLRQAGKTSVQQLDLSRYARGIYLISVSTRNFSKTLKCFF
ncbi:MAG: T9SS type A sorting domain-containing protein [Prevotellaceae bacterium]|jgi:hypothetical protein|nr:T9SS type A sorting domain-containing protein [Prevotellaceae bacterium]